MLRDLPSWRQRVARLLEIVTRLLSIDVVDSITGLLTYCSHVTPGLYFPLPRQLLCVYTYLQNH